MAFAFVTQIISVASTAGAKLCMSLRTKTKGSFCSVFNEISDLEYFNSQLDHKHLGLTGEGKTQA